LRLGASSKWEGGELLMGLYAVNFNPNGSLTHVKARFSGQKVFLDIRSVEWPQGILKCM